MTKKKNKKTPARQTREAKKAIVTTTSNKRSIPIIVVTAVLAVAAAAGLSLLLFPGNPDRTPATLSSAAAQPVRNGQVTYAASLFDDGQARHFTFNDPDGGTTIAYFILKSTDGVIRAAFDACDVCWPEGKGYVQDGTAMICRNCGRRFESVQINVIQGGCNPAPLNRRMEGDRVVIRVDDLKQGRRYFNFS